MTAFDDVGKVGATRLLRVAPSELSDHLRRAESASAWTLVTADAGDGLNGSRALFRPLTAAGWISDRPLSRERVRGAVMGERRRTRLPVEGYSGQSLRAGFVTEGFATGAAPHELIVQTGHAIYMTLERYRRDLPLVGNAVTRLDGARQAGLDPKSSGSDSSGRSVTSRPE